MHFRSFFLLRVTKWLTQRCECAPVQTCLTCEFACVRAKNANISKTAYPIPLESGAIVFLGHFYVGNNSPFLQLERITPRYPYPPPLKLPLWVRIWVRFLIRVSFLIRAWVRVWTNACRNIVLSQYSVRTNKYCAKSLEQR